MGTNSKTNKKTEYKKCTDCEKERRIGDYYNCKNPLFADGKVPICKKCLKEKIDVNNVSTVQKFLKSVNVVFDINVWNKCVESNRETFGEYMRRINSMNQHTTSTWEDSIFELAGSIIYFEKEVNNEKQEIVYEENNKPFIVTKQMIQRWGKGYTSDQYEFVENCYKQWRNEKSNGKYDLAQDTLFQQIAIKQLDIRIAREKGEQTQKLEETFLKFIDTADLSLKNKKDKSTENDRYSKWIEDIERYKPADYFKDKSLFKDFDGILDYFNRFILRPLKNLLMGNKDFDGEYTIEANIDDLMQEKPEKKTTSKGKFI